MKSKLIKLLTVILCASIIAGFSVWGIIAPDKELSLSERRYLAQMPALSTSAVLSGSFMTEFENYSLDQFPLRDELRKLKAFVTLNVFRQQDNNGYYIENEHAAKLDYKLDLSSVSNAAGRFGYIYESYLSGTGSSVFLSVIPDKSYYMSGSHPTPDFDALSARLQDKMPYARYIDISDTLELDSYYRTDPHWDQTKLVDTAQALAHGMGTDLISSYDTIDPGAEFYGAYSAQLAVDMEPDTIKMLTNDALSSCTLYDYESGETAELYNLSQLSGRDPYAVFLNGSRSLLRIENPNPETGRELIVFRDSFGSSIVPLLAEGYSSIILVDIRYISPERLGKFIEFTGQDVLFLYSSSVINSSSALL